MYRDKPYVIDIKLALSGVNDFKKKFKDVFQIVPDLQSRLHDMGIKNLDNQLQQLANNAGHYYDKLYNALSEYSKSIKAKTDESVSGALSEEDAERLLIKAYKDALGVLPMIKKEQESIEQVVKRSYKYQEEALLKNIELLKKEQVDSIRLLEIKHQILKEVKASNSTAPLQKTNKEFEKRLALMQKIKDMQETATRVGMHTEVAGDYTKELKDLKNELTDLNTPVEEVQNKLKHLSISPTLLKDIGRAEEKFRKSRDQLKKLGATKTELEELDTEFSYLIDKAVRLGDATDVKEFNTSLKKRKSIIQDLTEQYGKLKKAQLTADKKTKAEQNIDTTRAIALNFEVDTDTISKAFANAKASVGELTATEKQFKKEIEQSTVALDKQKQKLEEERRTIQTMLDKHRAIIDPETEKKALVAVAALGDEIKDIDRLINVVNAHSLLDQASVEKSKIAVETVKKEVRDLKEYAGNVKVNIQLSGGMKEAKQYATSLATDMQKVMSSVDKSSTAYKEMSTFLNQIALQQQRLNEGGKENYNLAKQSLQKLGERYQEYKKINAEADKLAAYIKEHKDSLGSVAQEAEDYVVRLRAAATAQLDLSNNTREHKKTLEETNQFQKSLQNAQRERVKLENQLYNLSIKLKNELANIERLKNSKKPYATAQAIAEANKQADELRRELKKVEDTMAQISHTNFGTLLKPGEITKVKAQVTELNRAFDETSVRVKDVKANLAELSSIKWGGNILKRAVAYASMYAGIYEMISGLRKGIEAVTEFDTQMRTIAAVFDVTEQRAKGLTQELMRLGLAYGGSVKDINEAALALGRAGIETKKVSQATEVVIKMAKLTGDSIATSASAIITYQQVFGATHPVLREIGDQLAYVANQSRMSTQDIGTFSNYALAAASAAGLSMEAINAMATAFSNAGVNASTIGTQIRRFSSLMKDNSTAAQNFFLKLGTTQELFAQQMQESKQSADEAMTWIAEKLSSMSNQEFAQVIQGMDILASNSITLLRNNADEFLRHFRNLNAGVAGEIDKADLIADGYKASFEKMKTAISQAFISLSESAAPVIQDLMDKVTEFFEWLAAHPQEAIDGLVAGFKTLGTIISIMIGKVAVDSFLELTKAAGTTISKVAELANNPKFTFSTVTTGIGNVITKFKHLGVSTQILIHRLKIMKAAAFANIFTTMGTALRFAVAGMWSLVRASVAFMMTPIGAAITAIAVAIGVFVYNMDDAAEKTEKLSDAQKKLAENTMDLKTAKEELADVMERLRKGTSADTEADIKRAGQLKANIDMIQAQIAANNKKIEQQELMRKAGVIKQEMEIVHHEIYELKLKNDDGKNDEIILNLEKKLDRLKQDAKSIEIKASLAKSSGEVFKELKKKIVHFQALARAEISAKPNTKVWDYLHKEIEKAKAELKSLGISDVEFFRQGDIDAKLGSFIKTLEGELAQKQLQLKMDPNMDPAAKAKLEKDIETIKFKLSKVGNIRAKIIGKEEVKAFGDYLKSVVQQAQQGFDVKPQLLEARRAYEEMFAQIKEDAISKMEEMGKAIDNAMPKDAPQGLKDLAEQAKTLYAALGDVSNPKEAQVILNQLNNIVAQMRVEYNKTGEAVIIKTQDMINNANRLNTAFQQIAGLFAQNFSKALGLGNMHEEVTKLVEKIDDAAAAENRLKLSREEINKKLKDGIDLSYGIRNAQLSIKDAEELEQKIQDILADQKRKLMDLDAQRIAILQGLIKFESKEALFAAMADIRDQHEKITKETQNQLKNLGAIKAKLVKVTKSADSAARNHKKSADEIERAATAFKRLEASYLRMAGAGKLSFTLGIESEMEKIAQLGKKAKMSYEDVKRVQEEYLAGRQKQLDDKMIDAALSNTDVETAKELWAQRRRLDQWNAFYEEREALIEGKQAAIKAAMEQGYLDKATAEEQIRQLDLEKERAHLEARKAMQQQYYQSMASIAGTALGEVSGILEQMYQTGLIKGKKWLMAIKVMRVAQAIMNTYVSASNAMATFPPPTSYAMAAIAIAKGMAQVAMIKAQKFHTGGYTDKPLVSGVGGKKDDELFAVLQKGEYVLSRNMVRDLKIEGRKQKAKAKDDTLDNSESPSLGTKELANFADSMKPEVVIVNSMDPAVVEDWATSRRGREVIQNIVSGG